MKTALVAVGVVVAVVLVLALAYLTEASRTSVDRNDVV
jgi:hypothetical protein